MVSMRLGAAVSLTGVLVALIPAIYFITLPFDSPTREFFTQQMLGLPMILYFTFLGAVITAVGLILFIKAARAPLETAYPSVVRRSQAIRARRPVESRMMKARPTISEEGGIVAEIEREIERIVQSEGPPAEAAEKPPVEVVTTGQDMVCPHCGALNPLNSTKCSKCKKKLYELREGELTCPVCGAPLRLSKKITEDLFACGLCFSELRIPRELREEIGLR